MSARRGGVATDGEQVCGRAAFIASAGGKVLQSLPRWTPSCPAVPPRQSPAFWAPSCCSLIPSELVISAL